MQVLVAEHTKTGGGIDALVLRQYLNEYGLRDQVDCARDLERLRNHSNRTLSRINETIGQRVHLPRTDLVSETIDVIRKNSVVFILGDPGVGKSVLLKKLVDHFRQEGEVLVTSIDNLSGSTIEEFTANLQIDYDFQQLLGALRPAPYRCMFIDKLEQALSDEQRSNVLYDLIHEIQRYNDEVVNDSESSRWRIVATCRADQFYSLLPMLRTAVDLSAWERVDVLPLANNDVEMVVETFPSLTLLSKQQHVQYLLHNPFILDFLTFPELRFVELPAPEILTESWLVELYWMQIVRNSERSGHNSNTPDSREQAVVSLGRLRLMNGKKYVPASELNTDVISALTQDRVFQNEDGRIGFVHDILDDWTISRILLSHWDQLPMLLREYNETLQLIKPMILLALRQLELKQDANQWFELLSILRDSTTLAARWYQTVLVAPLSSPIFESVLTLIEPYLFESDGILLRDFVRSMRTIHTIPSRSMELLFQGINITQAKLASFLAYSREPVADLWLPVWKLLFKNKDNIPVLALPEIAEAAYLWMKTSDLPLRAEVALLCSELLSRDFRDHLHDVTYDDDYVMYSSRDGWIDDQVIEIFSGAILQGADCISQEVQHFLNGLIENDDKQLAELLFGRNCLSSNWMPIAKHMPEVFVDITLKIFCDTRELKKNMRAPRILRRYGIKHEHIWRFPTDFMQDTPFFFFLRMHPTYGIKLIVELVNFATQKWVEITRLNDNITPLPQILSLSTGKREIWGDHEVYNWCLKVPPNTVALALIALRHWLDEYLKKREDEEPARIFDTILSQSNSFSIVALCVLVASENIEKRISGLLPILEQPAFWEIDNHRLSHMMMFGQKNNLYQFDSLARYILMVGSREQRAKLQNSLVQFPSNVPFFFVEEKNDPELVSARIQHMEEIASFGNLDNYSVQEHEEGVLVQFNFPKEIEQRRNEQYEEFEYFQRQTRLQTWAHLVASNKEDLSLSLEQAIEIAKEVEQSSKLSKSQIGVTDVSVSS